MDHKTLPGKYKALLEEVHRLTEENSRLKAQLKFATFKPSGKPPAETKFVEKKHPDEPVVNKFKPVIDNTSDSQTKIQLFMSLFKGRIDVYAERWENKNKGTSGYSPVCMNQWQAGVCGKPKTSCSKCDNKDYAALDERAIENHLRGNIVVGVYPMLRDETCYFLAVDFDEADWPNDISIFRKHLGLPSAKEKRRFPPSIFEIYRTV